ncbi:MAG TPA: hypothetical protein VEI05_02415 [Burkholderiaceae bacterium]|nr:hypothetical protein [Burkholderiaceae bacterium]
MPTASLAATARAVRPHATPHLKLAPGSWYWQAQAKDRIWVRLVFVPKNKIEVDISWNRLTRTPDVQLVFGLYGDAVEFGSLTGNGFNSPAFHRLGFGTFAVNIAIQALKANFAPSLPVVGVLSNTDEEHLATEERLPLEANRRAFWRRFGLDVITQGEPPRDYLQGRVGNLHVVTSGMLGGEFPRCISLRDFVRDPPSEL